MNNEIVVVSGLPRSGTSLMMQLLHAGGIPALTDHIRAADTDNPRGYYEFERVKKVKGDSAWLPEARGKVVKMVSQLLLDLPRTEQYRVVFMDRDLTEVLASQETMLRRLGRSAQPGDEMVRAFTMHLNRVHHWLAEQPNFAVLRVRYADIVARPAETVLSINEFLGGRLNGTVACATVDPSLYRNRTPAVGTPAGCPCPPDELGPQESRVPDPIAATPGFG